MPAPKKPIEQQEESPEIQQLRAELQEMREALAARPAGDPSDTLTQILLKLSEQRDPIREREVALSTAGFGPSQSIMSEAQSQLEALPEPEHPLDHDRVFVSKGKGLKIIRKARRAMADAEGNTWLRPGQHVDFAPNGEFRTRDPELVEWLQSRESFNREFWDAENIPGSVEDPAVALERVSQYAVDLNIEGLNEMENEERGGLNRKIVMDAIKRTQRQVLLVREKLQAQQGQQ